MQTKFYIYSNQRKQYWRKGEAGYTNAPEDAGHYSAEEMVDVLTSRSTTLGIVAMRVPGRLLRTEEQEFEVDWRYELMRKGELNFS